MNVGGLSVEVHAGTGPYLLLVHGMLASRAQFLLNLSSLQATTQPITIELLGHHESESPDNQEAYLPSSYVEGLEDIREALSIDSWYVGGCSLGAALTMHYVLAHPKRVRGQIFTNSSSAFADEAMMQAWKNSSTSSYERILQAGVEGLERIAVHPRHARRLPDQVKKALVEDSKSHNVKGIASTTRWTSPNGSIRNRIAEFRTPSLLVCGTREKRFQSHRAFAETHMRHLRILDLETGHGVNMEAAVEFNQAVLDFIKDLET